jgi:hypothetical protein
VLGDKPIQHLPFYKCQENTGRRAVASSVQAFAFLYYVFFDGQIGDGQFGVIGKHENVGDTSDSSSGISIDAETSTA